MSEIINIPKTSDVAVICEGNAEENYLWILLEADMLKFNKSQLIKDKLFGSSYRGTTKFRDEVLTMTYDNPITLIQVQDTNRKLKLKSPYMDKIGQHFIIQTKPELEILFVHHLDLYNEFNKVKSTQTPSLFLANHLGKKKSYLKSKAFIRERWTAESLCEAIKIYASKTKNDEYGLIDLLKS